MIRRLRLYDDALRRMDVTNDLEPINYWKAKRMARLLQGGYELYVAENGQGIQAYLLRDHVGFIERYNFLDQDLFIDLVEFLKHQELSLQIILEDNNDDLEQHILFSNLGFIGSLTYRQIHFKLHKKKKHEVR